MIRSLSLLALALVLACNQDGSPFSARAVRPGRIVVPYSGDRADGLVLEYSVVAVGPAPTTAGRYHMVPSDLGDSSWRGLEFGSAPNTVDPGPRVGIDYVGFELSTDGEVELTPVHQAGQPTGQRGDLLWCEGDDSVPLRGTCRPLEDAVRDPEAFECFGRALDGSRPPVECWQENLTLAVSISARAATRATVETRVGLKEASLDAVTWDSSQGIHVASTTYTEEFPGLRNEQQACAGSGQVTLSLITDEGSDEGSVLYSTTRLLTGNDYARVSALDLDVVFPVPPLRLQIQADKCLGGWSRKYDGDYLTRPDVWPVKACDVVWVYASTWPDGALSCGLPADPCACVESLSPDEITCFRFGERQLCSTPRQ